MADGHFQFRQPGAGAFYPPQHSNHRNLNRATSPHGSRRPFSNDTPSPSRSPVNPAPSHNFTMYNHNGYQAQHSMMNGGQSHPRYTGMQLPKYQQNHHPHHNQVSQHQHHHASAIGHQHTLSSGGYSSATPHLGHYGQEHGQNGNTDGVHQDDMDEIDSEHWMEQLKLARD